ARQQSRHGRLPRKIDAPEKLVHAVRKKDEAAIVGMVKAVIVPGQGVAIAMADHYLGRHERNELIEVQHLGQTRPAFIWVCQLSNCGKTLEIAVIIRTSADVALHFVGNLVSAVGVVEVAVWISEVARQKLGGEAFLEHIQAKTSSVEFDESMMHRR